MDDAVTDVEGQGRPTTPGIERTAHLIAEAAVRHLEQRLPARLREDKQFLAEIFAACRGAEERSIQRRSDILPVKPPDPRTEGPPRDTVAEILSDLDVEERVKCGLLVERALSIGHITDETLVMAAWSWGHDESIRIVAARRNGSR